MSIPAETLVAVIRDTLNPERLERARSEPGLAWQLDRLANHAAALEGLLAGRPSDSEFASARNRVRTADEAHDQAHRYAYGLLMAFTNAPDMALSAAATLALAELYPMGLQVINISFRRQVAAAVRFEQRLGRPDMVDGRAVLTSAFPGWDAVMNACLEAGRTMATSITVVDELEARASSKHVETRLFPARNAATATLALFLRTVQALYPADGDQTQRETRALLLQPWLGFQADFRKKSRTTGSAELDTVVLETDLSTEDEAEPT